MTAVRYTQIDEGVVFFLLYVILILNISTPARLKLRSSAAGFLIGLSYDIHCNIRACSTRSEASMNVVDSNYSGLGCLLMRNFEAVTNNSLHCT